MSFDKMFDLTAGVFFFSKKYMPVRLLRDEYWLIGGTPDDSRKSSRESAALLLFVVDLFFQ